MQGYASIGYLIFFFVLMYFLMIRPQQTQQKKRQQMISSLKEGDGIITVGGIHGVITKLKEDSILVRIAERTEIELQKSGVGLIKQ